MHETITATEVIKKQAFYAPKPDDTIQVPDEFLYMPTAMAIRNSKVADGG
jgi:hypothetical protein